MAFNKMFVMLPLMFAARKLDGEDPNIIFLLRCSYFSIQGMILLAVLYVYMCATKLNQGKAKDQEIYVSPPPQPFADPNLKTQYTKTTIGEQAISVAKKLGMSTITGICMTTGLHWYKGMIIGLAMQTVMGPLNLLENQFAKSALMGGTNLTSDSDSADGDDKDSITAALKKRRIFGEKYRDEISDKDEVVDTEGKLIVMKKEKTGKKGAVATKAKESSFEETMLDTWDGGSKSDIKPFVKLLTKNNVNFKTKELGWSPLMIMAAIGAEGSSDAIKKMKSLNASATIRDKDGWNALHWAAFHNSVEGTKSLMEVFEGMKLGLHLVKDLEGMTPLDIANKEGNTTIATYIKGKIEGALKADQCAVEDTKED